MQALLPQNFSHTETEKKWNEVWKQKQVFHSVPNEKTPYTVVMPPPNITGVLHLGHTLNAAIQDILIRRARKSGYNACWVPGCDHASIATEAKVVEMLKKEKNIGKKDLSREEFLKYVFEWKEKYGGIIYSQLELLGCSVDWSRKTFTMDKHYEEAVIKVFVELYEKGLIYKGARMINWDVQAKTALSDEEVEYKESESQLVYLKYYLEEKENGKASETEFVTIATQRPETIMGDVALCAHPEDDKYKKWKGRRFFIPLLNRSIPLIFDAYVDKDFGTGLLKITPAHDLNDYNLGLKHKLPVVDILNDDGTISNNAEIYVGVERFEARKKIIVELNEKNFIVKTEKYVSNIGYSQRTNTVVEPRISAQWFVKTETLNKKALQVVQEDVVKIHPKERFYNTYKNWMENPRDWCISRQLWWGQRIPAYYLQDGSFVVAENIEVAKQKLAQKGVRDFSQLVQDEDCLDTWFSSWIWPIEVFYGITKPNNVDFNYYYPTTTLVTGQDIIFFWVARMIMAGLEFKNERPFDFVYFTGMVRDKQGRKMSKSLGNSPDLINLIEQYGADAVRFGVMVSSPAGNDLLFDESSIQQGLRFNNKLWNSLKLLSALCEKTSNNAESESEVFANDWFENYLQCKKQELDTNYSQFKLSENLKIIYNLIWDDYCSSYLEWIKPKSEETISKVCFEKAILFWTELLDLLHPYMPFITEEIFSLLPLKEGTELLSLKQFSALKDFDVKVISQGELLRNIITQIREAKTKASVSIKEVVDIEVLDNMYSKIKVIEPILKRFAFINEVKKVAELNKDNVSIINNDVHLGLILKANNIGNNGLEDLKKDYEHLKKFLETLEKKLSNEKFIQNAKPEVIELEKKKMSDTIEKLKVLEKKIL